MTATTPPNHLTRGYLIALLAAAILSTTAIFIRYLTQTYQLPPLVLSFWRDSFVALTMLAALGLARRSLLRVSRSQLLYLAIYGLALAFFNALWTTAVALDGAAVATVLVYCSGGFTALLGRWLLQERLDWSKGLAVIICLGGCVLVSGAYDPSAWQANLWGILTGVISGLLYAIYSLMGRSAAQRGLNPWTTLLYTFGFAALTLLIFNLLGGNAVAGSPAAISGIAARLFWLGRAWQGWLILFVLAAVPTLAGFGLYNVSLGYLPSSVANLVVTLEPAFTVAIAYVLLGERLNAAQIAGALMILAGVVVLRLAEGRVTAAAKGKASAARAA